MWTFCSHPQTQCFTLEVEGGSSKVFILADLVQKSLVALFAHWCVSSSSNAVCLLPVVAEHLVSFCWLLHSVLAEGRWSRPVVTLCILVEQADVRQGRKKWDTRNVLGRSVFPRTLVHTSPAAATQECHELHRQWLNKLVTLAGADGREVESQKESQSGTQQRNFPVCLGPCWVMVGGVVPKCFWKLFSALSSFMKAGIASMLLMALTEVEKKGMKWVSWCCFF